jgi:hypothetical protein
MVREEMRRTSEDRCKGIPPLNDASSRDVRRLAVGAFAFVVQFPILVPAPHRLYDALGHSLTVPVMGNPIRCRKQQN